MYSGVQRSRQTDSISHRTRKSIVSREQCVCIHMYTCKIYTHTHIYTYTRAGTHTVRRIEGITNDQTH